MPINGYMDKEEVVYIKVCVCVCVCVCDGILLRHKDNILPTVRI